MKNNKLHKVFKLLKSMKFGIMLLVLLVVISIFGSIIPQERDVSFYQRNYSEGKSNLILASGLNDVYHSWYFIALFGLLSINLILCSITRLGAVINKMKVLPSVKGFNSLETIEFKHQENQEDYIKNYFEKNGIKKVIKREDEGRVYYFGRKYSIGYFGTWLIHVGFLITIIAYGYGQFTKFSTSVYGVPGSIIDVEGTELRVAIEDFRIDYREDGSINQYYSNLQLLDEDNKLLKSQEIFVNSPLSFSGYNFYQSATGWAADLVFMRDDEVIEDIIYEQTVFIEANEEVALLFSRFYPDFIATERGFFTRSNLPDNPMILYALFFNGMRVDMGIVEPGDVIEWQEFKMQFNNPRMYTYLEVNKLKGKWWAMMGALFAMVGLYLAFYIKPIILAVKIEKNKLVIYGNNKGVTHVRKNPNQKLDI